MKFVQQLILLCFFLLPLAISAQNYALNGFIRDKATQETLVGVHVIIKGQESKGVATDADGKYWLTLPEGEYTLLIHYMGFEEQEIAISLTKNTTRNIDMEQSIVGLQEVVISSRQPDENVTAPIAGVEKLEINEINKLPVLLGERDVIKSIQLMPGVQGAGEGSSGFYVRGGSADQNLILIDDVSLYNASQLMGFFSTFN